MEFANQIQEFTELSVSGSASECLQASTKLWPYSVCHGCVPIFTINTQYL